MLTIYEKLYKVRRSLEKKSPRIFMLTNIQPLESVANTLHAIGCQPLFSSAAEELWECINYADAVSLSVDGIDHSFGKQALIAAQMVKYSNKILVVDPAGCGVSAFRVSIVRQLATYADVICGKSDEIVSIKNTGATQKIFTNLDAVNEGITIAHELALEYNNIIALHGKTDYVLGRHDFHINNFGHSLMGKAVEITSALSAVIAAFTTVESDLALATYLALLYYSLCGEQAAQKSSRLSGFKGCFLDCLYQPDWADIIQRMANSVNTKNCVT